MIDPHKPDYKNTPASSLRPSFAYETACPDAAPLVSILTPYYETGEIFHETAESIFRQSLQQWEWIIVNDGSKQPEALEALERYRNREPRIRVVDSPTNDGLPASRNKGAAVARAPYFYLIDSDDLIEPTTLEKSYWYLESHPEFAFVSGYSVGFGAREYLWTRGFFEGEKFLHENLATGRAMVRASVHRQVGGHDAARRGGFEDWDFWLRCAGAGLWGNTIPEYLDWYRWREDHFARWSDLKDREARAAFEVYLGQQHAALYHGGFPTIPKSWPVPFETISDSLPEGSNRLEKRRQRCLIILPWFAMGGAEKFALDVVQQLTANGWKVTLAATHKRPDTSWMAEFGKYTPDIFVLQNFLKSTDHPRFLRYLIESRDPDVVLVTHSEAGYLLLPYLRAHCPGPAYVDYNHIEEEHWKNGGYPRYAAGSQELLDLNIVSSEHLKNWIAARGADPERIEVCYTNIDTAEWTRRAETREEVRSRFEIGGDEPVIMFAGRITAQKQPRVLGGALVELANRGVNYRAFIAGDGEDRATLEEMISENGLADRVHFLGSVPTRAIREYMSASDVFFLPSHWEGIALSIYEAMAMELAIVGADVGGQRELVLPECGILVRRDSVTNEIQAHASALEIVLADPGTCHEMGRRGRQRVEAHFRLEEMGRRMISLFERARELQRQSPRTAPGPQFGLECAARAVEYLRVYDLSEWLWWERERLAAQQGRAAEPVPTEENLNSLSIEEELRLIENSVAWRIYRLMSRLRLVEEPGNGESVTSAHERLSQITSTNYYKQVQRLRQMRLYRIYKRVRDTR